MELTKEIKECAFHIESKNGVCMEDSFINELKTFANSIKKIVIADKKDTVNTLKEILDCKTESCILTNPEIKNFLGEAKVSKQLDERFKPEGPYNSDDWFSNFNIDEVLDQVAIKFSDKKFLHIKYQMRDFAKNSNSELVKTDLAVEYKKGIRCFGVVFNTDYSKNNGQHWFSIFGDFSKTPFTIEYFNSSGEPPLPEITSWMDRTKHHLEKELSSEIKNIKVETVIVTNTVNQIDNHSCGSYSLYYIISRLEGVSYEYFSKNKIGDELMHTFRKYYLFRQPK